MRLLYTLKYVICCLFLYSVSANKKHGPYKTTVLSIKNTCDTPLFPYMKDPPALVNWYLYNSTEGNSLLGGKITILRTTKNVMGRIKAWVLQGEHRQLTYVMEHLHCRSLFVSTLLKAFNKKLNLCSVPKGTYSFSGVDINHQEHLWRQNMPYGKMLLRNEIGTHDATIACWELVTVIAPAVASNKKSNVPS